MVLQLGGPLHQFPLAAAVQAVGHPVDGRVAGDDGEEDERQLPVVGEHQPEAEKDDEDVHEQVDRNVVNKGANLDGVADARHDLAGAHRVEKALGQAQQMLVVTEDQAGVDELAGLDDHHGLGHADKYG